MSKPVTRRIGAASEWKQRSVTRATISEETLAKPDASATTTARPVERTAAQTVSSSNGTIERTLVGGFKEVTRVPANPGALDTVARASGGKSFAASDPDGLERVYEELGSQLGTREEEREITDYFSAGAGLFLLVGAALSTAWFRRVP